MKIVTSHKKIQIFFGLPGSKDLCLRHNKNIYFLYQLR